jgi:hypothetical protein
MALIKQILDRYRKLRAFYIKDANFNTEIKADQT